MKQYIFNKDSFEFYCPDGSTVQAFQIEDSNVWFLEIFPSNQSTESFESCQYSGTITFSPDNDKSKDKWNIVEYPDTWTEQFKQEFAEAVKDEMCAIELKD